MTIIHAVIQTIAPLLNSLRENVFSTTYFAGFLKNMSNIREAITSQLLYITVQFIPVQYVFHPASAEIQFVKDCAGCAPPPPPQKKKNKKKQKQTEYR